MSEYKLNWKEEISKKYNAYESLEGEIYYLTASNSTGEYTCRKLPNPSPFWNPDNNPVGAIWIFKGITSETDVRKEAERLFKTYVVIPKDSSEQVIKEKVEVKKLPRKEVPIIVEDVIENIVEEPAVERISVEELVKEITEIQKTAPTITVTDGICSITVPVGALKAKYTTDGKDVKTTSKIFRGPFNVTEGMIIKSVACYEDGLSEQTEYTVHVEEVVNNEV